MDIDDTSKATKKPSTTNKDEEPKTTKKNEGDVCTEPSNDDTTVSVFGTSSNGIESVTQYPKQNRVEGKEVEKENPPRTKKQPQK